MLTRRIFLATIGSAGSVALLPASARAAPAADTLAQRFPPPAGFTRTDAQPSSFAAWLRDRPLLPPTTPVRLHTGAPKARQDVHAAVLDIDIGKRDLQQCADAVMRLRAEWLFSAGRHDSIAFNDTGRGQPMPWSAWARGERPVAKGNRLIWSKSAAPDPSYASFRRYLDTVFIWAGTYSLERELVHAPPGSVEPGDVIIKGGFPGHAVLVADVVSSSDGTKHRALLTQSYMPAQNIHIIRNLADPASSPWYDLTASKPVITPEWTFPAGSLKRWP